MSRIEVKNNERSRAAKDQGKSNKYIMNHVSFTVKGNNTNESSNIEINNNSLSTINLK